MNASKLNFFGQGSTLDVLMEWERHATMQRIECPYASSCQVATVYIECGTCNETGITGKQKSYCCCHLLRFAQPAGHMQAEMEPGPYIFIICPDTGGVKVEPPK
jgi:hypothetical protein